VTDAPWGEVIHNLGSLTLQKHLAPLVPDR
jgi:hypothetical protein